jgi:hypothetical protein
MQLLDDVVKDVQFRIACIMNHDVMVHAVDAAAYYSQLRSFPDRIGSIYWIEDASGIAGRRQGRQRRKDPFVTSLVSGIDMR